MTEIDALKYELEQQEKSFNKLHKMYVSLLKQQGELEKENEKLWREIRILMKQGAEPSDAFKEYLDSISTEYDKFWQRKLQQAKKDGVI